MQDTFLNVRIRIALGSIVASSLVLALKWVSYIWTGSAALKSDALEGIVNVVAGIFALGALVYAEKPSDREHPYGHGKMENFSAAFEGGLVSLAAVLIFYEGVSAIVYGRVLRDLGLGVAVNALAGGLNGLIGLFLIRAGRKHHSSALEADGHHILSDFVTSVGVLLGMGLVWLTGLAWLDGVIAIFVGLILVGTGFNLVRRSSSALLDSEDPEALKNLVAGLNRLSRPEVIAVHELRTMRSGRYTHVDAHIVVPEYFTVKDGHDLVEAHCAQVLKDCRVEGEFHSHVDPCQRAYCAYCSMPDCPIRQEPLQKRDPITLESATAPGRD
jgi:cation diffusion facilitator family transporter